MFCVLVVIVCVCVFSFFACCLFVLFFVMTGFFETVLEKHPFVLEYSPRYGSRFSLLVLQPSFCKSFLP